MRKITPPQLVILSFLCIIIVGTIALSLPLATKDLVRTPLIDCLFTATSAVCVTGLAVKDTGAYFSNFGKGIIFVLFQVGAVGIMTFSTLFAVVLGRKLSFNETDIIKSSVNVYSIMGLKKLVTYIVCIMVTIELVGASLLFLRWRMITDWGLIQTLERSVFHAASAFCNAGFALFSNSFMDFSRDLYITLVMISLIFLGGIGFIVIIDLMGMVFKRGVARRVGLQTKIALTVSFILIFFGTIFILVYERNNCMRAMLWPERLLKSIFQSVSARTAGFNSLPIGDLTVPSLLFLVFLMFIGASPGSTGGGIKTCTFAVLVAMVYGILKNKRRIALFGRSIPKRVVRESLAVFFLGLLWICIFAAVLVSTDSRYIQGNDVFVKILFETASAFGTVGLSTGITGALTVAGKLCITATMFIGKIGLLTLMLALAFRKRTDTYLFPEENIMVG